MDGPEKNMQSEANGPHNDQKSSDIIQDMAHDIFFMSKIGFF